MGGDRMNRTRRRARVGVFFLSIRSPTILSILSPELIRTLASNLPWWRAGFVLSKGGVVPLA
jgi:hypothetical protein